MKEQKWGPRKKETQKKIYNETGARKKVTGRLTLFNQTKVVTRRKRPKKNLRKCKKQADQATTRTLMKSFQKKTGPRKLKIVKETLRFIRQAPI